MTIGEAARQVDHDQSWLSRIESLESGIHPNDARALLNVFGVTGEEAEAVVSVARQARQRGWWVNYSGVTVESFSSLVGMESDASAIRTYQCQTVPGLLQTEDYARAVIAASAVRRRPEDIDQNLALRLDRQALLASDDRPQFVAVLDEAVVRRVIGGRAIMRAQIERLLEVAEQQHIQIQVLPFDAGAHPGLNGSFLILDFPPPPGPFPHAADDRVVYTDNSFSCFYMDRPGEVAVYTTAFEQIRAEALSPDQSRGLLHSITKDLTM